MQQFPTPNPSLAEEALEYASRQFAATQPAYAQAPGSGCKTRFTSTAGGISLAAPGYRAVDSSAQAIMRALITDGPILVYFQASKAVKDCARVLGCLTSAHAHFASSGDHLTLPASALLYRWTRALCSMTRVRATLISTVSQPNCMLAEQVGRAAQLIKTKLPPRHAGSPTTCPELPTTQASTLPAHAKLQLAGRRTIM